ncbi:MAG: N-acetylglucosamine-6-phosphate deacetylase [Firmicutes bacterium]|nr:N-acetylglucosamine-6-phosphate deacetylase [Bacillota bacterium]
MIYRNAEVFIDGHFRICDFEVIDGRFVAIGNPYLPAVDEAAGDEETNLDGRWVIPGLVDVHTHGSMNADFSDGDYEGLKKMAAYLAESGVTSFAPAGMTLPYETLAEAFATGKKLHDECPEGCARLMGLPLEGPFFSEKKKGAQNGAYLRDPDFDAFKKLFDGCDGLVRIVDVAPELPGAVDFTAKASELATVSIAHTDASYEEAAAVLDAGATHLTHLYNAMPPIHHRKPGVIGAGSERDDSGVIAELICDGYHVHPSSVRMAFKLFPGRICLISDSLRCCGMPEGKYELGGQDVFLKGGVARLEDGTIAGSASNVYTCMLNAIEYGIPKETAITAATITPAKEIGADDLIGSIAVGKHADFIICDESLKPETIFLGGKEI